MPLLANTSLTVRLLGQLAYETVWRSMQSFTQTRDAATSDEIWCLEHLPVFTQGQAGKADHLLNPGTIPVIQADRGGQVTYHGPGQLVIYIMVDIARRNLGTRDLVTLIENSLISTLQQWEINSFTREKAPGVYTTEGKIASLGLRIRRGCSYHGLALNVAMDLEPFSRINPCGFTGMAMSQIQDYCPSPDFEAIRRSLIQQLINKLGYNDVSYTHSARG